MATLQWSKELELNVPAMDETHREFVDLLAQVESAEDSSLHALWMALIQHTEEHFGQEDRWMQATGFSPENCHSTQHHVVLQIMKEGAAKAAQGDLTMVRGMTPELASWFNYHAQTMDAALAQHMASVGFDTESGHLACEEALPAAMISGCGGACSQQADHQRQVSNLDHVAQAA